MCTGEFPTLTYPKPIFLQSYFSTLKHRLIFPTTRCCLASLPYPNSNGPRSVNVSIQIETAVQANLCLPSAGSSGEGWSDGCPLHSLRWRLLIMISAWGASGDTKHTVHPKLLEMRELININHWNNNDNQLIRTVLIWNNKSKMAANKTHYDCSSLSKSFRSILT